MHQNSRFNIMQEPKHNSRLFVVIDGQRTGSGHRAPGAVIVSEPMSRDAAIELADLKQAGHSSSMVSAALEHCTGVDVGAILSLGESDSGTLEFVMEYEYTGDRTCYDAADMTQEALNATWAQFVADRA